MPRLVGGCGDRLPRTHPARTAQVWELDSTLFRRHAAPSVHGYCEEQFTVMKCLNMKVALTPLPAVDAAAEPQRRPAPGLTRSAARKGSQPLRKLVQLVRAAGPDRPSLQRAPASALRPRIR